MTRTLTNFQQRFLATLLSISVAGALIFSSHYPSLQFLFVGAITAIQAKALWEYYGLAIRKGLKVQRLLGTIFSVIYVIWHAVSGDFYVFESLLLLLALSFAAQLSNHTKAIETLATTLFGFVYITLPLSLLIDLNFSPTNTSLWIIYLIIITKITDIAAYIAGKTVGKHLLAPVVSPKKTVEGAIAGLAAACLSSFLFFWWCQCPFSTAESIILGALIGIIAQIGDLAESLLKRDANVKDSSDIPGFGGMLDIVDSVIFTAPLLYFWLAFKGVL